MQGRLLRQIDKGKLPEENYPYKMCSSQRNLVDAMRALKRGPNEVIVFFVGGEFCVWVKKVGRQKRKREGRDYIERGKGRGG